MLLLELIASAVLSIDMLPVLRRHLEEIVGDPPQSINRELLRYVTEVELHVATVYDDFDGGFYLMAFHDSHTMRFDRESYTQKGY